MIESDGLVPRAPAALGRKGVVAASHPRISTSGIRVLADGGNAIDATLAMAATSWLALPGQCGVGGEAFVVVREPDGQVWTVDGGSYTPADGTADFYYERGHSAIPMTGPLSVAVPGEIAALSALHARGATRDLNYLWQDSVTLAEDGIACTAKTRLDIIERADELLLDETARDVYLPDGAPPEVGYSLRQPALAESIRKLAHDPESFYTGELADRAMSWLIRSGAPFTGAEWGMPLNSGFPEPLMVAYQGHRIFVNPLPSPGWMLLQQASICDGKLARFQQLDADSVHWMAEAARQAFRDRSATVGTDTAAWQDSFKPEAIAAARTRIARNVASRTNSLSGGDTTSIVCVDAEGRAVSLVHSLAFTFGSRSTVPGTGILLNNRLARGAYLIEGHPNEVNPARRPLNTLCTWIADSPEGQLAHVGSIPGGDGQVQWNMQMLSHLIDHSNGADETVSAPRFIVFPGSDANVLGEPEQLICEAGISPQVREILLARGHRVETVRPFAGGGSAMVISASNRAGTFSAAADPRMGGVALGL